MAPKKKPTAKKVLKNKRPKFTIHWTDKDLDRLSKVTPADQEKAKAAWRKNSPRKYKNLLDAEVTENGN